MQIIISIKQKRMEEIKFYRRENMIKNYLVVVVLSSSVALFGRNQDINPFAMNNGEIPTKSEICRKFV